MTCAHTSTHTHRATCPCTRTRRVTHPLNPLTRPRTRCSLGSSFGTQARTRSKHSTGSVCAWEGGYCPGGAGVNIFVSKKKQQYLSNTKTHKYTNRYTYTNTRTYAHFPAQMGERTVCAVSLYFRPPGERAPTKQHEHVRIRHAVCLCVWVCACTSSCARVCMCVRVRAYDRVPGRGCADGQVFVHQTREVELVPPHLGALWFVVKEGNYG